MATGTSNPFLLKFSIKVRILFQYWIPRVIIRKSQHQLFLLILKRRMTIQAILLLLIKMPIYLKIIIGPCPGMNRRFPFFIDSFMAHSTIFSFQAH